MAGMGLRCMHSTQYNARRQLQAGGCRLQAIRALWLQEEKVEGKHGFKQRQLCV